MWVHDQMGPAEFLLIHFDLMTLPWLKGERVYEYVPFLPSSIQVRGTPEHAAMEWLLKWKSFMCHFYLIQKHNGGILFEVHMQLTSKWRGVWQSLFLDSPVQKHLEKYFSYFSGLKVLWNFLIASYSSVPVFDSALPFGWREHRGNWIMFEHLEFLAQKIAIP